MLKVLGNGILAKKPYLEYKTKRKDNIEVAFTKLHVVCTIDSYKKELFTFDVWNEMAERIVPKLNKGSSVVFEAGMQTCFDGNVKVPCFVATKIEYVYDIEWTASMMKIKKMIEDWENKSPENKQKVQEFKDQIQEEFENKES